MAISPLIVSFFFLPYSCYISNIWVFFFAFLTPIFLILMFNMVILLLVIWTSIKVQVNRRKIMPNKKGFVLKDNIKTLVSFVGVSLLFGMTWLFAIFTFGSTNVSIAYAMQFLFATFNILQGFFIFLFFVLLSADARQEWQQLLCCKKMKYQRNIANNTLPSKNSESRFSTIFRKSAILERNVGKYFNLREMTRFTTATVLEKNEKESFPGSLESMAEPSHAETPPNIPSDQH